MDPVEFNTAALASVGFGSLLFIVGALLAYISISYGIYLLAKKYSPSLHPALSWVPIVQLYPLLSVAQLSPWWMLLLLAFFVPAIGGIILLVGFIVLYHHISVRTERGIGTTILLVFFSVLMIPWLGRKVHKKTTTPAWILGIISMVLLAFGGSLSLGGMVAQLSDPALIDSLQNNPEIQQAIAEAMEQINS